MWVSSPSCSSEGESEQSFLARLRYRARRQTVLSPLLEHLLGGARVLEPVDDVIDLKWFAVAAASVDVQFFHEVLHLWAGQVVGVKAGER